jgi:phage-related minor tail protein
MDWLQNSKKEGNHDKMKYYAQGIQKFQRQLGLTISNFSDILKEETKSDLDIQTKLNEGGDAAVNGL